MRIIAGYYKGRRLKSWQKKLPVRPMTDRVKESLFNVLTPFLFESCKVLDLFSGTGSLSLEALSRGALEVHAVEKNPQCVAMIKKNAHFLENPNQLIIHKKNVFSFLRQNQRILESKEPENKDRILVNKRLSNQTNFSLLKKLPEFDVVLIDPPFPIKAGDQVMESLCSSQLVHKKSVIAIETSQKEDLKKQYFEFYLFSKKDFNDKKVWFYRYEQTKLENRKFIKETND